ncbi:MAG: L,D-transpeptidase [Anaerolineales bacterium]
MTEARRRPRHDRANAQDDPASPIGRRGFLSVSLASLASSGLPGRAIRLAGAAPEAKALWARITEDRVDLFSRPRPDSARVSTATYDDVLEILRETVGRGLLPHNHMWYETPRGYLWSSFGQPAQDLPNTPLETIPDGGIWTEVSVPFVDGRREADPASPVRYRLYWAMILNVDQRVIGADGRVWYRVHDENAVKLFAPAEALRPIPEDELTPIRPESEPKSIRVNLTRQDLSAWEGPVEVYYCRIASGFGFLEDGEKVWNTPVGRMWTWRKMISRHMSGGTLVSGYDLPGVGWAILFSGSGAAVHSTYWHNDFGTPRSHGCINTPPDAAKWLFRWSLPAVEYKPGDLTLHWPDTGTQVIVEE